MPNLIKEITVFSENGLIVTSSLATGYVLKPCFQCHHVHLVEFNSQQDPGRDFFERFVHTCFRTTIRRGSALTAISSWHFLDYNTVGAFISSTLAYNEHLYMKVPAGYDND